LTETTDRGFFTIVKPAHVGTNFETLQTEKRMSLEDALNRNSDLLEKNAALMEKILAGASSRASTSATTATTSDDAGGEKPKRTTKPKEDAAKGVTLDDVKPILNGWLTEFPKNGDDDHPETVARKAALKGAFEKLGATNLKEVAVEKLGKLKEWAEAQVAKGRLVPDENAGGDDDDMLG
jgi:hypothetical protein